MRGDLGKHACKPRESGMVGLDSWSCPFCAVVHRHGDVEKAAVNQSVASQRWVRKSCILGCPSLLDQCRCYSYDGFSKSQVASTFFLNIPSLSIPIKDSASDNYHISFESRVQMSVVWGSTGSNNISKHT